MSTEPAPFWNWAITGLGGVLNIMERYIRDNANPSADQIAKLEYQCGRMVRIVEHTLGKQARPFVQVLLERNFAAVEVQDDSLDAIEKGLLACPSTGEEVAAGLLQIPPQKPKQDDAIQ